MDSDTAIICDFGTGFSKVGFAGAEAPQAVFPTILGKLRHDSVLVGMEEKDWFIGAEAQDRRAQVHLQYPVSRSAVANWDNLEKICHHAFYQVLHMPPEQYPLMVTEPPGNKVPAKERLTQMLFETFNVPALYLANQAVLSLYASGQTSGTTVESGEGMTHFVPIVDGCALNDSIVQTDIAGQDLTLYLLQLLADSGNLLVGTADREYIRDLKERCCYVALDFEKEKSKTILPSCQQSFRLPDGQEISLRQEHFLCPEALFDSSLIGRSTLSFHLAAFRSISSCPSGFWKALFSHIVLSGGTGSCPGLRLRLQKEMGGLVSPTLQVKVFTSPYAKYGAWVGGSILCSLSTFKDMWVTSKEYEDVGASIINRRNF